MFFHKVTKFMAPGHNHQTGEKRENTMCFAWFCLCFELSPGSLVCNWIQKLSKHGVFIDVFHKVTKFMAPGHDHQRALPCASVGRVQRVSARFRAFPCVSAHFRAFPSVSARFRAFPRVSVRFRAFPRVSVCFRAFPCVSVRFRAFPCVFACSTRLRAPPRVSAHFHAFPRIFSGSG